MKKLGPEGKRRHNRAKAKREVGSDGLAPTRAAMVAARRFARNTAPPEKVTISRELALNALWAVEEVFAETEWIEVLRMTNPGEDIQEPTSMLGWRRLAISYEEKGLLNCLDLMEGLTAALEVR